MKIAALTLSLFSVASAFAPSQNLVKSTALQSTLTEDDVPSPISSTEEDVPSPISSSSAKDELSNMAKKLNPIVNYYDPLGLADAEFWEQSNESTIGFLRHAEIKHGRVAMAAFVGYCVQSNFHFPWKMTLEGANFPSTDLSPEQQWDAIPEGAKWQIIGLIGFLELWSEYPQGGKPHYMRGGRPGDFPDFDEFRTMVHPVPFNLFDPFGFSKNASEEKKANGLIAEINNGRLAMIGIFGFLAADKVEGSVPLLKDIAIPYDGDVMAPFAANFHTFLQ